MDTKSHQTNSWMKSVLDELVGKDFTGRLEINFFRGGVSNVNVLESFKPPENNSTEIKFTKKVCKGLAQGGY